MPSAMARSHQNGMPLPIPMMMRNPPIHRVATGSDKIAIIHHRKVVAVEEVVVDSPPGAVTVRALRPVLVRSSELQGLA